MKHYTHLALIDTGRAVEMLPDFQNCHNANDVVKTGTDDVVIPKDPIQVNEKSPEIGHGSQSFIGITCQSEGTELKQISTENFTQPVDNKRVGIVCHQKSNCPELESNQHSPKGTSPSS